MRARSWWVPGVRVWLRGKTSSEYIVLANAIRFQSVILLRHSALKRLRSRRRRASRGHVAPAQGASARPPSGEAGRQDRVDALELGRGELGQRRNVATSTRPRVGARSVLGRASLVPSLARDQKRSHLPNLIPNTPKDPLKGPMLRRTRITQRVRISYESPMNRGCVKPV